MTKLTDTQLLVLSAASQRTDGLLSPPEKLHGAALSLFGNKLVERYLACETVVGPAEPFWRQDDAEGRIGLRITSAGLEAIGIDAGEAVTAAAMTPAIASAECCRDGSKIARILDLLRRPEGASVEEVRDITSWLPHTIRAALTGLRKRGFVIEHRKTQSGRAAYHAVERLS